MAFTLNPTPTAGTNAFGMVPGAVDNPIPNAPQLNQTAGADIMAQLGGQLSPGTINALQNASASFGVGSGMPGSPLSWNSLYGNIAGAAEKQQQQGLANYNQITGPAFQTNLASQNALNAAAPDPTQAASYAEKLYNQYLAKMSGGGHVTLPGNTGFNLPSFNLGGFGSNQGQPTAASVLNPVDGQQQWNPYGAIDPSSGQAMDLSNLTGGGYDFNSGENFGGTSYGDTYQDPYAAIGSAGSDFGAAPDWLNMDFSSGG